MTLRHRLWQKHTQGGNAGRCRLGQGPYLRLKPALPVLALLLLLWLASAGLAQAKGNSRASWSPLKTPKLITAALIMGNNHHIESNTRDLSYAESDAVRVASFFRQQHPEALVELLVHRELVADSLAALPQPLDLPIFPPTLSELEAAIQRLQGWLEQARQQNPTAQVLVFFYFSGHGELDGSLHLDEYLTPPVKLDYLSRLEADQVLFVADACHAGAMVRGDGEAPIPRMPEQPARQPPFMGLLASTDQVPELDAIGGGFITHLLLGGLYGLADRNNDARVTWEELGQFMLGQVRDQPPAPSMIYLAGPRPWLPLVELTPQTQTGLRLTTEFPSGMVQVYRKAEQVGDKATASPKLGVLVAQFVHRRGQTVLLRLPEGHYTLVRLLAPGELKRVGITTEASELLENKLYPAKKEEFNLTPLQQRSSNGRTMTPMVLAQHQVRGSLLPDGIPMALISAEQVELTERMRSRAREQTALPIPELSLSGGGELAGTVPNFGAPNASPRSGRVVELALVQPLLSWDGVWAGVGLGLGYAYSEQLGVAVQNNTDFQDGALHRLKVGAELSQSLQRGRWRVGLRQRLSWAPGQIFGESGPLSYQTSTCTKPQGGCESPYYFPQDVSAALGVVLLARVSPRLELGPGIRVEGLIFNPRLEKPVYTWSVGLELRPSLPRRFPRFN